ncbi:unnamed protein product, partial [Staurois parvus]
MTAQSCDQLCLITCKQGNAGYRPSSASCQCPSVPALSAHPCHLPVPPSVQHFSAHRCHISVPTCLSVSPISASQCYLSVLPISAAYQCPSVLPISVIYECCISVPISDACQCPSVPLHQFPSVPPI